MGSRSPGLCQSDRPKLSLSAVGEVMWKWKRIQGASEAPEVSADFGNDLAPKPSGRPDVTWDVPGWMGEVLGPPLPYSVSPKQGLAISHWVEFPKLNASAAQWLVGKLGCCSW